MGGEAQGVPGHASRHFGSSQSRTPVLALIGYWLIQNLPTVPRAGLEPARDCSRGILSLPMRPLKQGLRGQNGTERERKQALGEWGFRLIPPQSEEVRHSCGTMGKRVLSDRLWV
jgi:hypothetical protein